METSERRKAIIKLLCRRRYITTQELASEFCVSERTIYRDIEILSMSEPIYTKTGRYGGGIYIVDGYYSDRSYFSELELSVLNRIVEHINDCGSADFSENDIHILKNIIKSHTKPTLPKNENT